MVEMTAARDLLLEFRLAEMLAHKRRLRKQQSIIQKAIKAHQREMRERIAEILQEPDALLQIKQIEANLQKGLETTELAIEQAAAMIAANCQRPDLLLAAAPTLLLTESTARKRLRERKQPTMVEESRQ
jgi:hypothetical protein